MLLLADLKLLAPASPASGDTSNDRGSGGLLQRVATSLLAHLRSAPAGVIVVATARSPLHVPACLRTHGGFETNFELLLPTPQQRAALIASWLPPWADADAISRQTSDRDLRQVRRALGAVPLMPAAPASLRVGGGGGGGGGDSGGGSGGGGDMPQNPPPAGYPDDLQLAQSLAAELARQESGLDRAHARAPPPRVAAADAGAPPGSHRALREKLRLLLTAVNEAVKRSGGLGSLGIDPPSGALLFGPSGVGKSHLMAEVSAACGWPVVVTRGTQLYGAYVGETEAAIRELFRKARERAPCLLLLDDIHALGRSRGNSMQEGEGGGSVAERALSTLLNEMDGVGVAGTKVRGDVSAMPPQARPVFFVGLTNRPELVDAALLRPGRLEQLLCVPSSLQPAPTGCPLRPWALGLRCADDDRVARPCSQVRAVSGRRGA